MSGWFWFEHSVVNYHIIYFLHTAFMFYSKIKSNKISPLQNICSLPTVLNITQGVLQKSMVPLSKSRILNENKSICITPLTLHCLCTSQMYLYIFMRCVLWKDLQFIDTQVQSSLIRCLIQLYVLYVRTGFYLVRHADVNLVTEAERKAMYPRNNTDGGECLFNFPLSIAPLLSACSCWIWFI